MDLSGIIFVALALGWAGYLIPKALRHHEEVTANRPVDNFSDTMRVLDRTPVTMRELMAHAVATPAPAAEVAAEAVAAAPRRSAPKGAARRRRRVLGLLLVLTAGVAAASYFGYTAPLGWWAMVIPGALVIGWLVLCRLMVRKAPAVRRRPVATRAPVEAPAEVVAVEPAPVPVPVVENDDTDDGSLWDPLPLTLPTYVSKPAARRTVRTIDLTQTGVTSSGHNAEDSKLARQAEAAALAPEAPEAEQRKAAGA